MIAPAAAGMAKRRDLEKRLREVLAARHPRQRRRWAAPFMAIAVIGGLVVPCAVIAKAPSSTKAAQDDGANAELIQRVVIDAGHGGRDAGGRSPGGTLEKDLNLKLSILLKAELEGRGIEVIMTRDKDVSMTMGERALIAAAAKDALFVSLHCNVSRYPSAEGIEVFHPQERADCAALGKRVLDAMVAATDAKDRGVKSAKFSTFKGIDYPCVLIENGFISNAKEAAKLEDPAYLTKLAQGIANGLLEPIGKDEIIDPKAPAIEAASMTYDQDLGIAIAEGDVVFRHPKFELKADRAEYATGKDALRATGKQVKVSGDWGADGEQGSLLADNITVDLKKMILTATGSPRIMLGAYEVVGDPDTKIVVEWTDGAIGLKIEGASKTSLKPK